LQICHDVKHRAFYRRLPITVRDGQRNRLVFSPVLVENAGEPAASVRGELAYFSKNAADEWERTSLSISPNCLRVRASVSDSAGASRPSPDRHYPVEGEVGGPRGIRSEIPGSGIDRRLRRRGLGLLDRRQCGGHGRDQADDRPEDDERSSGHV
jgi:hypothetical protein